MRRSNKLFGSCDPVFQILEKHKSASVSLERERKEDGFVAALAAIYGQVCGRA